MALRFSGSIIELTQELKEGRAAAEHPAGQQVALHQKGSALQTGILALADHPEHALMSPFQVLQENPLKLAAPVRVRWGGADLLQRKAQVAAEHLRPKGLRASEKALGQTFNLPDAELLAPQCPDELVDVGRRL
jgi:hypothetical protein